MVTLFVGKNDGCFDLKPLDIQSADTWTSIKIDIAKALYTEEDLFAVSTPDDVILYKLPENTDIETTATREDIFKLMIPNSQWVLDIFGSPLRECVELGCQISPLKPSEGQQSNVSASKDSEHGMAVEGLREPYIHVGTWLPSIVTDASHVGPVLVAEANKGDKSGSRSANYEDILCTSVRAREYIARFRRTGKQVSIVSMQTTLLPLAIACPQYLLRHGTRTLYAGMFSLSQSELEKGFIQAVRVWYSFDCEKTISVTKKAGAIGLKPLRQEDGWIIVQAVPNSPCFDAGMRANEIYLTHINGIDVSPHAFPAVSPQYAATVSWKSTIVPLVEKCETCIFTFF